MSFPIIEDSPAIILLLKSSVVGKITAISGTRELLVMVLMKQHHIYRIFLWEADEVIKRDIVLFFSDDRTEQNKNVSEL